MEEHLGSEFTMRVILTRDKTLVRGDVLVEDKPEIRGIPIPPGGTFCSTSPYNDSSQVHAPIGRTGVSLLEPTAQNIRPEIVVNSVLLP